MESADAADTARTTAAKIIPGKYARQTRHSRADIIQDFVPDSKMEMTIPLPADVIQTPYGRIRVPTVPVKTAQLLYRGR